MSVLLPITGTKDALDFNGPADQHGWLRPYTDKVTTRVTISELAPSASY